MSSDVTGKTVRLQQRGFSNSLWADVDFSESVYPPPEHLPFNNIAEAFFAAAQDRESQCFSRYRDEEDGEWTSLQWGDALRQAAALARLVKEKAGVSPGDRVALFASASPRRVLAEIAVLSLGAVSVPISPLTDKERVAKIVALTKPSCVILDNRDRVPGEVNIDSFGDSAALIYLDRAADAATSEEVDQLKRSAAAIQLTDLAAVVFDSGEELGVCQTHAQIISAVDALILSGLIISGRDVFVARALEEPLSRIVIFGALASGGDLIFPSTGELKEEMTDWRQLARDMRQTNPRVVMAYPSFLAYAAKRIDELSHGWMQRRIAHWGLKNYAALRQLRDNDQLSTVSESLKFTLADVIVSKLRGAVLGTREVIALSNGRHLTSEQQQTFANLGVFVSEVLSPKQSAPLVAANSTKFSKTNTSGRPFEDVIVAIEEDRSEILVCGPSISGSCWDGTTVIPSPHLHAGWLRTGLFGDLGEDGYITLLT